MNPGFSIRTMNIDRKKYPVYNVFEIRPTQGRIGPFEGIIFEVGFSPIDNLIEWQNSSEKSSKQEKDFMAFLRIVRVHVTETKHILSVLYFLCYAYFPFSICFVIHLKYEITSFIINKCRRYGKRARRAKRRLTNY